MRDAVIVDAVRSPVGKRNGGLAGVHPVDLSAQVLQALAARNDLDPATVDDVIWGCVSQVGEQAACIGRYSVLAAGWPESVPGFTVDRQCGSSQQAVHLAAAGVVAGHYDIAVAGGVESMSRVVMGATRAGGLHGEPYGPMVRERYNNFAVQSGHRRRDDRRRIRAQPNRSRPARPRLARARRDAAIDDGRFTGSDRAHHGDRTRTAAPRS